MDQLVKRRASDWKVADHRFDSRTSNAPLSLGKTLHAYFPLQPSSLLVVVTQSDGRLANRPRKGCFAVVWTEAECVVHVLKQVKITFFSGDELLEMLSSIVCMGIEPYASRSWDEQAINHPTQPTITSLEFEQSIEVNAHVCIWTRRPLTGSDILQLQFSNLRFLLSSALILGCKSTRFGLTTLPCSNLLQCAFRVLLCEISQPKLLVIIKLNKTFSCDSDIISICCDRTMARAGWYQEVGRLWRNVNF